MLCAAGAVGHNYSFKRSRRVNVQGHRFHNGNQYAHVVVGLEQENRSLKTELVRLEEEIEAMAADAEETQHATMADQTVSMVGQVAQILPAVLDKWFSLQEQKNALLAEQMRRNAPPQRPQAPQNDVNNMYHEEAGY